MKQTKVYKILSLILILQWAFIQLLAMHPNFIEKYYTHGLYQILSKFLRVLLGWIPFSIGDLFYTVICIWLLRSLFLGFKNRNWKFKASFFKVIGIIAVFFFFFNFNWGLNYVREPLPKVLSFKTTKYSTNELISFTQKLIKKINNIQFEITKNDTLVVTNLSSKKQLREMAFGAYKNLSATIPELQYTHFSVKSSLFSIPLTYMGFAGYLNPFTNEAQVNYLIPKNSYPATVCHEMAHQIGIASESGANFVGYLASIKSDDSYFKYAGYLMALKYCLYEVYRENPSEYNQLKVTINKGILKDIQQNQDFWKSYQNWSEKYFKNFYNSFLKANKQKDGIKGYNKLVFLLINYYKTNEL